MKKLKKCLISMLVLCFCLWSIPLFAGGSGVYPNGAEAFLIGVAPPPGFYGINYLAMFNLPKYKDDDGDTVPSSAFDKGTVFGEILRTIWFSNYKILNGTYGQHLFIPVLYQDINHTDDTFIPYFIYDPFLLAHHFFNGKLHTIIAFDIYTPGMSDDDNPANLHHNYWTFEPIFAFTWLQGPFGISFKFMYDFSTEEDDHLVNCPSGNSYNLDRTPGQEFHFDYNVSYAVNKKFRIGIGGFWYQQVTDDDYDGKDKLPPAERRFVKQLEENHSKQFAIGPGIWFQFNKMSVTLRYQHTIYERNAPEMHNFWVKLIWKY